jgi:rRNA maturation protein Nop10
MINLTIDQIKLKSKTITENGCWIPNNKPEHTGYVRVSIGNERFYLHRIVMCLAHNISYYNLDIEACHNTGCDTRCFNPDHVRPGSRFDNNQQRVADKTHHNSAKEVCPKCGGRYKTTIVKTGFNRGQVHRRCSLCPRKR